MQELYGKDAWRHNQAHGRFAYRWKSYGFCPL